MFVVFFLSHSHPILLIFTNGICPKCEASLPPPRSLATQRGLWSGRPASLENRPCRIARCCSRLLGAVLRHHHHPRPLELQHVVESPDRQMCVVRRQEDRHRRQTRDTRMCERRRQQQRYGCTKPETDDTVQKEKVLHLPYWLIPKR